MRFILLPGHRFDTVGLAPLIKDIEFGGLIADQGLRFQLDHRRHEQTQGQDRNLAASRRAQPLDIDKDIYKWRHLVENSSASEGIQPHSNAKRQDSSFEAMIYLATAVIHSR